jgi:hypothetical protein
MAPPQNYTKNLGILGYIEIKRLSSLKKLLTKKNLQNKIVIRAIL